MATKVTMSSIAAVRLSMLKPSRNVPSKWPPRVGNSEATPIADQLALAS